MRRQISSTILGVATETVHNGLTTTTKRGGLVVEESTRNLAGTIPVAGRIDIVWDSQIDIVAILLDCHALIGFGFRFHRSFGGA